MIKILFMLQTCKSIHVNYRPRETAVHKNEDSKRRNLNSCYSKTVHNIFVSSETGAMYGVNVSIGLIDWLID